MRPALKTLLVSAAVVLLLTPRSFAQTSGDPALTAPAAVPSESATPETGMPTDRFFTAQDDKQTVSYEVIGASVHNQEGESIGKIDGLLFDENDRIIAGIVSVGGFLGIGAKNVAVNWNEFQFQPENEVVIASLSREQLEAAPTFTDRQQLKVQAEIEQREREMVQQPGPGIVAPSQ
jgi:hypothetical protein